jgi:hypothetical protein
MRIWSKACCFVLLVAPVAVADTTLQGTTDVTYTATYTAKGEEDFIQTDTCQSTRVRAVDTTDASSVTWASCATAVARNCQILARTEGASDAGWIAVPHSQPWIYSKIEVAPSSGTQSLQVSCTKSGFLSGSDLSQAVAVAMTGGASTIVLIGGVNGVADQADPGSPDVVCPTTTANCLYLSTTTGWWGATASNGTDTTTWEDLAP